MRLEHYLPGKFDGIISGPPCQCFSALANLVRACGNEPKFGNLIPEYERCVAEAQPAWFLMEEVPQAPEPAVPGYAVKSFLLDNAWLPGEDGDGLGQEQRRKRRFSFGMRGGQAPDLRRWIEVAALELPWAVESVTQQRVNNSQEAKGRVQHIAVKSDKGATCLRATVTAAHSGEKRPKGGKLIRYTFEEACRLQGLPEGFLEDASFTKQGKLKAVANGVPIPMGRALARAIRQAVEEIAP